ncbi:MAG: hypothetical protein IK115_01210 [Lachnospiraceae bacterium]|nr:hypothetical protein [Lachnospiraceae bacterium]
MKKDGNGVFLVLLLISVALVICLALWSAKKSTDEVKAVQQTEAEYKEDAREMKDAMSDMQDAVEAGYQNLDDQLK